MFGILVVENPNDQWSLGEMARSVDAGVDFIICDWNMPRMTGIDLLQQFRTVDPDVPFVMLTGRNDMDSVTAARDLGVTGYLLKPFSQEQLEQYLASVLTKETGAAA